MQRQMIKSLNAGKHHQKGHALIELGIAIGILAVLVVGGLAGVQAIMTSGKVSDQARTLTKLQSTTSKHSLDSATNAGNNPGLAQLIGSSGWEARSVNAGAVTSAFGSAEALTSNGAAMGSMPRNSGFIYTLSGAPQTACPGLAQGAACMAWALATPSAARGGKAEVRADMAGRHSQSRDFS